MKKVIYNLVFNRKKQLNGKGEAPIQVEANLYKKRTYFSTNIYIKPCQWDEKRQTIKNHPNMDVLNQYLQSRITELERKEVEALLNGNSHYLQKQENTTPANASASFTEFMKKEIENSNVRQSTLKNHLSTLQILRLYKRDVSFEELTYNFLCKLETFLLDKGYHRNTVGKHMKHLKRYINVAINKEVFDMMKYPFRRYKIKHTESKRAHLTPDELHKLETLKLDDNNVLRRCLDLFLFSCYTGLRFSDIVKITNKNFIHIENKPWLVYSSVKTNTSVRLPLALLFEGKAIPIYERYRTSTNTNTLFSIPTSGNSNINKQLRRICKMACIEKNVSFHVARHTNATLLLYNGANITTVQKLLGHKSIRTTEIYSNIMDMTIIRDLEKIKSK